MYSELNKEFALIVLGGRPRIVHSQEDGTFTFITLEAFNVLLANRSVSGQRGEDLAKAWLADPDRREYRGLTFDPSGSSNPNLLNIWRGFALEPEFGNARPGLDFIFNVICGRDLGLFLYVVAWMAQAVQQPHKKPGTALLLIGAQGTGKSTFAEIFLRIFGDHYLSVNSADRLTRQFNQHMTDKCVIVIEEAPVRKYQANALKDLITSERMLAEPKGVDAFRVPNHLRLIICTNDPHALAAQMDERRYCVIRVSKVHQEDQEYFGQLRSWMDNGGAKALLHFLQRYDISGVDLRTVPRTEALREQKVASLPLVERFVFDALQSGYLLPGHAWERPIARDVLLDAINSSRMPREAPITRTQMGAQLNALFPTLRTLRAATREANRTLRPRLYVLPSVEDARRLFSEHLRQPITWEDLDELEPGPRLVSEASGDD